MIELEFKESQRIALEILKKSLAYVKSIIFVMY